MPAGPPDARLGHRAHRPDAYRSTPHGHRDLHGISGRSIRGALPRGGCVGLRQQGSTERELVAVIVAAADGRRTVAAGPEGTAIADEPHKALSLRELEVVIRLATGEPAGDIAADLGISIKTVSTFRARALYKLGLQSNADLTRYALEHHLIV